MKRAAFLISVLLTLAPRAVLAKRYDASGMVLRVDSIHHSLEISCRAVPGYMDAMVMTFPVRDSKELEGLKPGTSIDFTLDVEKDVAYVENIRVHAYENPAQEPMASRQLQILEEATARRSVPVLQVGQGVPDFALIDQNNRSVEFSKFAGKVVAITFIYTRCPLPNFCFRMSNNFGVLQKRFAAQMGKDLVLLSITFDPDHDRPAVLADYARSWTKPQSGWYFLTGPTPDVQKICWSFGMNFWQDEGLLTHSLRTIVVDRQGRIAASLNGNDYTAKQLGDLVESVMNRPL
jgi:protein SCO1